MLETLIIMKKQDNEIDDGTLVLIRNTGDAIEVAIHIDSFEQAELVMSTLVKLSLEDMNLKHMLEATVATVHKFENDMVLDPRMLSLNTSNIPS